MSLFPCLQRIGVGDPCESGLVTSTRLETRLPFDGTGVMRYLAGHAVSGVESGDNSHYQRLLGLPNGRVAELVVELDGSDAVVATLDDGALPAHMVPRVRRLFDLDADSVAIDGHLSGDPVLAAAISAHPGIRLPGALDPEEQLLRTMVGQQISIAAARTVVARLAAELDGTGLFPTASQFAERGLEVLRGPGRRVAAIHGVALALSSGSLDLHSELSVDELTTRLVVLPGVGPWTAGYVAMRALGAPDVLLSTDLVLLKGAERLGLPISPKGIAQYAKRWAPFRSYAGLHLWRVAQAPA